MYGLHLTLSIPEGEFMSLTSFSEAIPAESMTRLLQFVKTEVGGYLDKDSEEQLDAFIAPAAPIPITADGATPPSTKTKRRKTSPSSSAARKIKKRQATSVKVI